MLDPGRSSDPVRQRLGVGVRTRDGRGQAADRFRPLQRVEVVLNAQHRRSVDSFTSKNSLVELSAFCQTENLRQRPSWLICFEALHRARGKNKHAMRALAA